MSKYLLAPHVHVAVGANAAIFLDLRRDEYVGIDERQAHALYGLVVGWPNLSPGERTQSHAEGSNRVAATLAAKGLLTTDCAHGKEVSPFSLRRVERILDIEVEALTPEINSRHLLRLTIGMLAARFALRVGRLDGIVERLRQLKSRGTRSADLRDLHWMLSVFVRTRPWIYSHRHKCLLDSLVLMDFLLSGGLLPTLVLGVRMSPFAAHAWVQCDQYVLNDRPDHVNSFSPIVVV